eukprot:scaffold7404_cov155-Skeletonema_marinoi.AAC.1
MLKLEQKFKNDEELIKSMPSYEWDTVWTYQKALVTAMSTAVETVEQMPPPEERDFGSSSDDDSRDHYDSRDHSEDDSKDDESSSDDGDSTHDEL